MLTYSLDNKENESIYEYLYNCIKRDIVDGKMRPNEKLPSKRAFANNHGISVVTVENTYGQLMAEGYIYSKPKSGFYVSEIEGFEKPEYGRYGEKEKQILLPIAARDNNSVSEREFENSVKNDNMINLVSNHTAPENFPFSIWAKLVRGVLSDQDAKLMISPPAGGVIELREAIARHLREFRGILCESEQIIIGAGTEYLYSLIVQLLGREKIYGLENPSSKKIRNIYQALGVKVMPLEMDSEGIKLTPENLTMPDIIQISPSHHFPTGIVTSVGRRYGLLQWANETDSRYVIEDDYDSEFRLRGKPIPSLFSMDATDKVIYFNTFTKSLASTIRISYMVLPKPLLDLFYKKLGFYSCTVSNFEQYTLAHFIEGQYFEKHINRMRNHYRELRDKLIEELKSSDIGDYVTIKEENSGLHFLMEISTVKPADFMKEKASRAGVNIGFLSDYYYMDYKKSDNSYEHTAIINYSGLHKEDMQKVVEALCEAWGKYIAR